MSNSVEVEFRSRFSKSKYDLLMKFLKKNGNDLGADDKRVWFFIMPDKLLKVTHNISKKRGKITLKLSKIGYGSTFEEIEFPIAENDVDKAVRLFTELGHSYLVEPIIFRHNFEYEGVELALKYSKSWGYHMELEILVAKKEEEQIAEEKIRNVANKLDVQIMDDQKLQEFTQKLESTYKNPIEMPVIN